MGDIANQLIEDEQNGINRLEVKKYYIVWQGKTPGIYTSWEDCKPQVDKVKDAKYKSFTCDYCEAKNIFSEDYKKYIKRKTKYIKRKTKAEAPVQQNYIVKSLAVDAACSMNVAGVVGMGPVEYQGINVETGKVIFKQGPFKDGTNNVGEFLAIVHALALLNKHGSKAPVYSDSKIAISWVKDKKAKTNLKKTSVRSAISFRSVFIRTRTSRRSRAARSS